MSTERPALVLLPGLACDAGVWAPQLQALADWQPQVADVHTRHGSIAEMAAALLVRHPGRLALAGTSMGGMVALEAARQAPQRIAGLALVGTTARPEDEATRRLRENAVALYAQGRAREVIEPNAALVLHADHARDAALVRGYLEMVLGAGTEQLVRQNRAVMGRPDARPHLPALRCPVLVLCGEDDPLTPPALSREIAGLVPGAVLQLLPRCGHLATLEQPQAVVQALRGWLQAVARLSRPAP